MLAAVGATILGGATLSAIGYLGAPSQAAARNGAKQSACSDYDRGLVHDTAAHGHHCPVRVCTDHDTSDTVGQGSHCAPTRVLCTDTDSGPSADAGGQGHHC